MKILMVCLGNICRSPLAEGILQKKSNGRCEVDSAGTAAHHLGEAPDPRMIATASRYQIDISQLRARQFTSDDFDLFDRIYVMDESNYKDVCALATRELDIKKVSYLLEEEAEVPDPYYGGEDGFENVYQLLNQACEQILLDIE